MADLRKAGVDFYVKVTTTIYGEPSTFSAFYFLDSTPTVINYIANPFQEVVETVTVPHTAVVRDGPIAVGSKTITVDDAPMEFLDGEKFQDPSSNIYGIRNLNTTPGSKEIYTNGRLITQLNTSDVLTQVGNTGVYEVLVNISTPGIYTIVIKNLNYFITKAESVEIVEEDFNDLQSKITKLKYKGFV